MIVLQKRVDDLLFCWDALLVLLGCAACPVGMRCLYYWGASRRYARGYSSDGRAPALHAGGREFESLYLHFGDKVTVRQQHSSIAQLVEHAAVNRRVVGSSPTWGVAKNPELKTKQFSIQGFAYAKNHRITPTEQRTMILFTRKSDSASEQGFAKSFYQIKKPQNSGVIHEFSAKGILLFFSDCNHRNHHNRRRHHSRRSRNRRNRRSSRHRSRNRRNRYRRNRHDYRKLHVCRRLCRV